MNNTAAFAKITSKFEGLEGARRNLQRIGSDATKRSKQAIFSLQREDLTKAADLLRSAERLLKTGSALVKKDPRLNADAAWRAGLEEFCEASFLDKFVRNKNLFPPQTVTDDPDILIGGIADFVGELVRRAVRAATDKDVMRVKRIVSLAEELVEYLTSLDLTGNLRSKGDQSRQHLRKLEDVQYDVSRSL